MCLTINNISLLFIGDISLMFISIAVMVLLFASFFIALRNVRQKQIAYELLQKQKEETELQKLRTEQALTELKATQVQLIHREKMASLGELTAGIAHEIQNPLNFVKNFSEVSTELADELSHELSNGKTENLLSVVDALKENLATIVSHTNRADSIIKGMMLHARTSTGQKESTNLSHVIDEYLRLSYLGFKTKNKSIDVTIQKNFDDRIENIMIIPGDIGRVLLNLFNNAFYSVKEKKNKGHQEYRPVVCVATKKNANTIEIRVRDNGMGIPSEIRGKILQPFFTTKPAGQGTGLGLSLSYDVIKAHGGELHVETEEGEFADFKILLPLM